MQIFTIVVTYNGMYWYERCFSSLFTSEIATQVIVIDNSSSDGTTDFIKEKYPEIILYELETNIGFGQANNIGIKHAIDHHADYVFLLNQDAWIERNVFTELIQVSVRHPEYGILSPIHLNAEKTEIESGMMAYLLLPEHTPSELISDFYLGFKKEVYDTNYVLAAAWFLPIRTIQTVGGFDPIFFHYAEDDNYISRVLYHGFKIGIIPSVTVCHDARKLYKRSVRQLVSFDKWLLQRSTDLLYKDNHVNTMIKDYLKLTLLKAITLNWNTFKENLNSALFLIRNKKSIINSRNNNKNVGLTWL